MKNERMYFPPLVKLDLNRATRLAGHCRSLQFFLQQITLA